MDVWAKQADLSGGTLVSATDKPGNRHELWPLAPTARRRACREVASRRCFDPAGRCRPRLQERTQLRDHVSKGAWHFAGALHGGTAFGPILRFQEIGRSAPGHCVRQGADLQLCATQAFAPCRTEYPLSIILTPESCPRCRSSLLRRNIHHGHRLRLRWWRSANVNGSRGQDERPLWGWMKKPSPGHSAMTGLRRKLHQDRC
jgi:hypothetical protein